MTIETFDYTATITNESKLSVIELTPDLYAYKLSVEYHSQIPNKTSFLLPKSIIPASQIQQNFINKKNLNLLKAGKAFKNLDLIVMPLDIQEGLRLNGWKFWDNTKFHHGDLKTYLMP